MMPNPTPYAERCKWELLYIGWCLTQDGIPLPPDLEDALLIHGIDPNGFE